MAKSKIFLAAPNILENLKGEISYVEYRLGTLNTNSIESNQEAQYVHNMIFQYNYLLGQLQKHYSAVEKASSVNSENNNLDHDAFFFFFRKA
jgi:hypothetical protein